MRMRPIASLLFAASLLAGGAARAHPGDLNRCIAPDGHSVFTDKPCDEVGAIVRNEIPKDAGAHAPPPPVRVHVHDCARTPEAVRDGLQAALATGDVNTMAAFYHWPGLGGAEADDILRRLQAIIARPYVSVELLGRHDGAAEGERSMASTAPVLASGIEIAQTRSSSDPTPVRTELTLTPYMGCWWVRF